MVQEQQGAGVAPGLHPPAWLGSTLPAAHLYFYMLEPRLFNLEASCALSRLDTKSSVH